jgi:hypothetical protein
MENARLAVPASRARELCDLLIGLDEQVDAALLMQALGRPTQNQGKAA